MKMRFVLVAPLAMCCTIALAQDNTSEPPAGSSATHTTTYQTPQGQLDVNWGQPAPHSFGPPPAFAQLANGAGSISSEGASAYPPLANDFIHADRNRDGRISKAEYDRWASRPQ